jgi:hypothetical protein
MSDTIVLDLGEYGEVLVEPATPSTAVGGVVQASRTTEKLRVKAQEVLKRPVTGLANLFLATLPEATANDQYQLDEFTVEFEVGLEAEIGADAGAVAKVTPNGGFTCTYTWKRKPEKAEA